ncbi:MAG TPA: DUF6438 domain-containing protein, partial [Flavobacteriales bacterium]|nr:DUF6438 domain-containing protein [Flavobacteriales bacterium]
GTCKAYRIDVYRSGYATYDGRAHVEKMGKYTTHVGEDAMDLIASKAEGLGFFSMKDKYDGEVTDLPSTFIRVVAHGKNKQVIGRVGQPVQFKELAAFAEAQLLPLQWVPVADR